MNYFKVGLDRPLFLMAGPCVIESEQLALDTAGELQQICSQLGIPFIYKSSFEKANRSSSQSYRGLGIDKGLAILEKVRSTLSVPVVTDVHENTPLAEVASVVDVLQTPALLCRQTSFIQNVAAQSFQIRDDCVVIVDPEIAQDDQLIRLHRVPAGQTDNREVGSVFCRAAAGQQRRAGHSTCAQKVPASCRQLRPTLSAQERFPHGSPCFDAGFLLEDSVEKKFFKLIAAAYSPGRYCRAASRTRLAVSQVLSASLIMSSGSAAGISSVLPAATRACWKSGCRAHSSRSHFRMST